MRRTGIVAAAIGRYGRLLCLVLVAAVMALWVGVSVARADQSRTFWSGAVHAGVTVSDVYDGCNFRYYYDEFDKGTADYGRVFLSMPAAPGTT